MESLAKNKANVEKLEQRRAALGLGSEKLSLAIGKPKAWWSNKVYNPSTVHKYYAEMDAALTRLEKDEKPAVIICGDDVMYDDQSFEPPTPDTGRVQAEAQPGVLQEQDNKQYGWATTRAAVTIRRTATGLEFITVDDSEIEALRAENEALKAEIKALKEWRGSLQSLLSMDLQGARQ